MLIQRKKINLAIIFLLMYYCYLNSMRLITFPYSSVTVPLLLSVVLILIIIANKGKIQFFGHDDKLLCFTWCSIALYIFLDNKDLSSNLIEGGMIQLYIMICFLLFMKNDIDWISKWLFWTELFVMIHALATVVFYFDYEIYYKFVNLAFTGSVITDVLKYYQMGYMCGLSSHFSTNGMILGVGFIVFFERCHYLSKNKDNNKFIKYKFFVILVGLFVILYAIILSSKRAILFSAIFAIVITYLISSNHHLGKRVFAIMVALVCIYFLYLFAVQYVPGLDTIANKFMNLEGSSAGVLNGRIYLWELSKEMFFRSPIIGMGYGSYKIAASEINAFTLSAHNYYLQVLSELGIIGLSLYLLAFLSAIFYTLKLVRRINQAKESTINFYMPMLLISLEIQILVLVYSFTATSLMYYSILIPYFMACTVPRAIFQISRTIKNQ